MAEAAVVVGIGMVTPVGGDAIQTFTSVRAGISGFAEIPWMDKGFEPFVVASLPDDELPELDEEISTEVGLTTRETRMLRLAGIALEEAFTSIPPDSRPALILGMPEIETTIPIDSKGFLARLSRQAKAGIDLAKSAAVPKGRASGLLALEIAMERLSSGKEGFVIIGGVESYKDLYVLGTLDMEGRVKSNRNLDGFIPGEGAAFLVMTSPATALAKGIKPLCKVLAVASAFETGHLYSKEPYKGEGLAEVFGKIFSDGGIPADPISTVYAGFNGENHWAKEWGVAYLRNAGRFAPGHAIEHPADCYGDPGAAAGPLLIGLAGIAMPKNFRNPPFLVFCSSDRGDRAAAVVGR